MAGTKAENEEASSEPAAYEMEDDEEKENDDNGATAGKPTTLSDVKLATKHCTSFKSFLNLCYFPIHSGPGYPNNLNELSAFIHQSKCPYVLH